MLFQNNELLIFQAEEEPYKLKHSTKFEKWRKFLETKRKPFYSDRTLEQHIEDNLGIHRKWE